MKVQLQDSFNFYAKLKPSKVNNAAKVLGSYYRAKITKKPAHRGLPISIAIEPTTSCNLRCPECPSGLRSFSRPTGMLEEKMFKKIMNELSPTLTYLTFYFQGEPYLHPKFLDWVAYASQKGVYTATSTNAHFLNDENAQQTVLSGLDRIIISIDGTTQETYQQYRVGGQLEKVLEGTRNLIRWKKKLQSHTPHIIFQFLVVKPNQHQMDDIKLLAKQLGVDAVKFKTAQIYDYEKGSELIPTLEKYSRYRKKDDGTFSIKNKLLNHCWKMWHSCVITWDGKVVPCCFDKDAAHSLGDLNHASFSEIWQGEAYRQFRAALLTARSNIEICKNCTDGTKVWA